MAEYRFHHVGKQDIKAEEFLAVLKDDKCVEVRLEDCVIEGDVDVSKAKIALDKNDKYPINKPVNCWRCTFKDDVSFTAAQFGRVANFTAARFSGRANFEVAEFIETADFTAAWFSGRANFTATRFSGVTDFAIAQFGERADFRKAQFSGEASFNATQFGERANFAIAQFGERAFFNQAQFDGEASFEEAKFNGDTNFGKAQFDSDVIFRKTRFKGDAIFNAACFHGTLVDFQNAVFFGNFAAFRVTKFTVPANFLDVEYYPDTLFQSLRQKPTQFYLDGNNVDAASSPHFKRYVDDQQFIRDFKEKHHCFWNCLWQLSSDYGRSFGLWASWSMLFVLLFALAYTPSPDFMPDWWQDFWKEYGTEFYQTTGQYKGKPLNFWYCSYLSIVTFTTLGFGDIVADNGLARFLVTFEVVLGYVMLGGLISILANKLARRS